MFPGVTAFDLSIVCGFNSPAVLPLALDWLCHFYREY
jgi:hypothetical protein